MAYIYRYGLRNSNAHSSQIEDLQIYKNEITGVVSDLYRENLKEVIVSKRFFELKLYRPVSNNVLKCMGKYLRQKINADYYGFVRLKQTFVGVVYPRKNAEQEVHIEFLDVSTFDNSVYNRINRDNDTRINSYRERARAYFERRRNSDRISPEMYNYVREDVINNSYLDVLESYVDDTKILDKLSVNNNQSEFLIYAEGYLRFADEVKRENLYIMLENPVDKDGMSVSLSNGIVDKEILLDLKYIRLLNESGKTNHYNETKDDIINLHLEKNNNFNHISKMLDGKCEFKVHNVGQAQAVSVSKINEIPFMYFDYGLPYGKNAKTKPFSVNLEVGPYTSIIISHLHKDHWNGITKYSDAYNCDWYIPKQKRKVTISKIIADIILNGKQVYEIHSTYNDIKMVVTCDNQYGSTIHQSGLTCRLNSTNKNILIMGDQNYDCVSDLTQFVDIDILVATHHGGIYSAKKHNCIPHNTKDGIVIYSYGVNNSYSHPSKVCDYQNENWTKCHRTPNGDFVKIINLK